MSAFDRLYVSINVALLACMTAMNLGLPFWRDMPMGDGFDYGLTSFVATWFLLRHRRIAE